MDTSVRYWLKPPALAPNSAACNGVCSRSAPMPTTTRHVICVKHAAPMPTILPTSSWKGVAAFTRISIMRLLFSSATPAATILA